MVDPGTGVRIGSGPKGKDPFLDLVYIEEVNKRINKDAGLFCHYQINPYTKKTLDYTTEKITTRKPKTCVCQLPGYCELRESYYKAICPPQTKYYEPQTSSMEYGWFPEGTGYYDRDNYDERFTFSHKTAEFIKTHAMIKAYDHLMKELAASVQMGSKAQK